MPRFDLSGRGPVTAPRAGPVQNEPRPRRRKGELGKRVLWTVGAAFVGYGVWRFMESQRDKPPVECVTVSDYQYDEEEYDYE